MLAITACRKDEARSTGPQTNGTNAWFENVASESGIDFIHQSGQTGQCRFPEITVGGVGLLDYDADGDLDVYFVQGGSIERGGPGSAPNRLYRNDGNWKFTDVTEATGTGDATYGSGCSCADYDGDGDVDVYVTNLGSNVLLRNNGNGAFEDVTSTAGTGDEAWGASSAFLDYDRDGDLDLFVANYIHWSADKELFCVAASGERDYCNPMNYKAPARDTLYKNLGNGRFVDASLEGGLTKTFGNGLGVACADYNGDGLIDIYVANDGMANQLWINNGDGSFVDQALLSGCALNAHGMTEAGMGVVALDVQEDGDLDLLLSHLRGETNTLYINSGGMFDDTTASFGLAAPSLPFTGFGLGAHDFNHDGHLDVYVANGSVRIPPVRHDPDDPFAEPNQLFAGTQTDLFEEVFPHGGTRKELIATSRGAAFGDLDNDGDVDIIVVNKDAPPYLLCNIAPKRGEWTAFRMLNRGGSDALGAVLRIEAQGRTRWRMVQPAYGYCASNDPRVHVGLGSARRIEAVTVRWPDGAEESFGPFDAGRIHVIRWGRGKPR